MSAASATSNHHFLRPSSDKTVRDKTGRRRPTQSTQRKNDLNKNDLEAMRNAYDANAKRISKLEQVVQQLSTELGDDPHANRLMSTSSSRSKRRTLQRSDKQQLATVAVCARKD